MNDRPRLEQLHLLMDRLERMPASPKRDWMLNEVRARAVDVETGVRPGPIRRLDPDDATAEAGAREVKGPKRRDTPAGRRPVPSRPRVPAAAPIEAPVEPRPQLLAAVGEDRLDLLEHGGELCLGDPPAVAPEAAGRAASPPWARGLRG